jgi:exopolysaccharide biosynthesis protein
VLRAAEIDEKRRNEPTIIFSVVLIRMGFGRSACAEGVAMAEAHWRDHINRANGAALTLLTENCHVLCSLLTLFSDIKSLLVTEAPLNALSLSSHDGKSQ